MFINIINMTNVYVIKFYHMGLKTISKIKLNAMLFM